MALMLGFIGLAIVHEIIRLTCDLNASNINPKLHLPVQMRRSSSCINVKKLCVGIFNEDTIFFLC